MNPVRSRDRLELSSKNIYVVPVVITNNLAG